MIEMDKRIVKSLDHSKLAFVIVAVLSFLVGGIYNEMIVGQQGITLANLFYALVGALYTGVIVAAIVFLYSLVNQSTQKPEKE